jgi:oxaloacetate decarboxylase alpha subunit
MKMETEIRTQRAGVVAEVKVKRGEGVTVGQTLLTLS